MAKAWMAAKPSIEHMMFLHEERQIANFKTALNTVMPLVSLFNAQEWQRWQVIREGSRSIRTFYTIDRQTCARDRKEEWRVGQSRSAAARFFEAEDVNCIQIRQQWESWWSRWSNIVQQYDRQSWWTITKHESKALEQFKSMNTNMRVHSTYM